MLACMLQTGLRRHKYPKIGLSKTSLFLEVSSNFMFCLAEHVINVKKLRIICNISRMALGVTLLPTLINDSECLHQILRTHTEEVYSSAFH